ncbi:MAG: peptidoglycan DD-metalloendopeptidase family protein [Rhodothermales bacterium]
MSLLRSKSRTSLLIGLTFVLAFITALTVSTVLHVKEQAALPPAAEPVPVVEVDEYGFERDHLMSYNAEIERGETFSELLQNFNVSRSVIQEAAALAEPVFSVRKLRSAKPYRLYLERDTAKAMVYVKDHVNYVVFDFRDTVQVYQRERPVEKRQSMVSGAITSTLVQTLNDQTGDAGQSIRLALDVAKIFAWQVDFSRLQKHDAFTLIYDESVLDGKPVRLDQIVAAKVSHRGREFYAFRYTHPNGDFGYYDADGRSAEKAFLMAPVEYSRISSRYSLRRFHPVQRRYKAHLGTDYAAPKGTPIMATGDGVVLKAGYTRGNGRYVKIKHDDTYQTAYLHMSKIGSGIKAGTPVKQGEVIGYVGSTGLATGNHVCYRFWQNGKQVDPFMVVTPPAEPLDDARLAEFEEIRDQYMPLLDRETSSAVFASTVTASAGAVGP